jgi:hypothetical protein
MENLWIGGWVGTRAGLGDVEKRKFFTLPGLEPKPVFSRYTDYAIPAPYCALYRYKLFSLLFLKYVVYMT